MGDALIGRTREIEQSLTRLRDGRGVRIAGEAGSGKTRLLRELCARLARRGDRVVETFASPATRAVPLGPLLALLPTEPSEDLGGLIRAICHDLDAAADGSRLVVSVDDIQHLDEPSVALLSHLLAESDCDLLCTVRSGEPLPDGLAELWSTFDIAEVPVTALDEDEVASLATSVLGGPVTGPLAAAVADRSGGNPLLVRELLLDARDAGQVVADGDGWDIAVPLDPGRRTVDVVRRRVARLAPEVAEVLEMVAVADRIRLDLLPDDAAAVDTLEDRSLVRVARATSGDRWEVLVDHPLVREALVAALPTRRRVSLLRSLAQLVIDAATPDAGDPSRVVEWLDAAGSPIGADQLIAAAREALAAFDLDRAERWAVRAGEDALEVYDVQRTLGEILRLRGDLEGAAAALAMAEERARDDADVVSVAIDRAAMLAFQLGRAEDALDVLGDAARRVGDPGRSAALKSEATVIGMLLGRFDDALAAAPSVAELESADDQSRWSVHVNVAYVRVMLGQVDGIEQLVDDALPLAAAVVQERPHELDAMIGLLGGARLEAGRLRYGSSTLRDHVHASRSVGDFHAISASVLAQLMLDTCDPEVHDVAAGAIAQHEWLDPFGSAPLAIGVAAIAAARCGDPDRADAILARAADAPSLSEPWATIWFGRARGNIAAVRGDADSAIEECFAAADAALDTSHVAYGIVTLHDAVRMGAAERALGPIERAVERTTGADFLGLLAAHTRALVDGSARDLAECARRAADLGAPMIAAVAHGDHARVLQDSGDAQGAAVADVAAQLAARRMGPFTVPAPPPLPQSLSARELDVALAAASGSTSRQVADSLFLSVRTVDNHLRNVYAKLELSGRDELASVLAEAVAMQGLRASDHR